jgi:hypothetical protein
MRPKPKWYDPGPERAIFMKNFIFGRNFGIKLHLLMTAWLIC